MHGIDIGEPDMPVNAGALIEPALEPAGIHPHHQDVGSAGIGVLSGIEIEAL